MEVQQRRRDIVRLNVGGTTFVTSRETLLASPFFQGLLRFPPDLEDEGAYFVDRSPAIFAIVLELLRTSVLFWTSETELRAILIEADFFLIKERFQHVLCPIRHGLYTVGKDQHDSTDSHPWILFVETSFNADKFRPCQVLLTGVVDEEVLLRHPAEFGVGGFVNVTIRGRILSLSVTRTRGELQCSWDGRVANVGERILTHQSDPEPQFPKEELQLKARLSRTKSKGRKVHVWFEELVETGEILLWKQKADMRTYSNSVTVLCKSLFIYSNHRTPLGLIFLSGRVPFLIRKRVSNEVEDNYVTVIALERERQPRVANIDN